MEDNITDEKIMTGNVHEKTNNNPNLTAKKDSPNGSAEKNPPLT